MATTCGFVKLGARLQFPGKIAVALVLTMITAQFAASQSYTILTTFDHSNGSKGQWPYAGVIVGSGGKLYGTTLYGGSHGQGVVFKLKGTTENVLHSFGGTDGGEPMAGVIDSAGTLYGTTSLGGTFGAGTVFEVTSGGKESVLYSFQGTGDGNEPQSDLVLDSGGNVYGTASLGGASGYGTAFKVASTGALTVLHSFGGGADGQYPYAGVVLDSSGNIYGTTGGDSAKTWGTVFKISPSGTETVLYSFQGGTDGAVPMAPVVLDSSGNLYGTTFYGGAGYGVVYKVGPNGGETVLYTFAGGADGEYPMGRLVLDSANNVYGTTNQGGEYDYGTVFEVSSSGKKTTLHSFKSKKESDGAYPGAGLVGDSKNGFYGTTSKGGAGNGIVFKLVP